MSLKNWKTKECELCNKEYYASWYRADSARYCSKECWNKRASVINICKQCWEVVKTYKSVRKKYCNRRCRDLHYRELNKGDKSHFWKWWVTSEDKKQRTCAKYKEWRRKVFERDWYKCVLCSSTEDIQGDHIKQQAFHPELRYNINNGRTLCKECHLKTDSHWMSKIKWQKRKQFEGNGLTDKMKMQ